MTIQEQRTLSAIERFCNHSSEKPKPDWEQRRYEIAKELYSYEFKDFGEEIEALRSQLHHTARLAVDAADILIAELKKSTK